MSLSTHPLTPEEQDAINRMSLDDLINRVPMKITAEETFSNVLSRGERMIDLASLLPLGMRIKFEIRLFLARLRLYPSVVDDYRRYPELLWAIDRRAKDMIAEYRAMGINVSWRGSKND